MDGRKAAIAFGGLLLVEAAIPGRTDLLIGGVVLLIAAMKPISMRIKAGFLSVEVDNAAPAGAPAPAPTATAHTARGADARADSDALT